MKGKQVTTFNRISQKMTFETQTLGSHLKERLGRHMGLNGGGMRTEVAEFAGHMHLEHCLN